MILAVNKKREKGALKINEMNIMTCQMKGLQTVLRSVNTERDRGLAAFAKEWSK